MNITDNFVDKIYYLKDVPLDKGILLCVRKCLIDYFAAIIGGAKISQDKISNLINIIGEKGDYSIVGQNYKVSLQSALLVNGIESHTAELDDGVISGIIHPGAPIITALMSYSENKNISFQRFTQGIIGGYEAACRLADCLQPSHKKCGYHASATCGTVGAALGIAIMEGLPKNTVKEVLSISLASSHGTLKVLEDSSELKPYNIATAAINGVVSVYMAKAGFIGADNPLEGEAGFLTQMSRDFNPDALIRENKNLYIENVYFKPYASCRYTHPAIEAGMKIKEQCQINPEKIESIKVATYDLAVLHHDHTIFPNISSAKMSIPFGASIGLLLGNGDINSFTSETISNPDIKAIAEKVTVTSEERFSNAFPEKSMGSMEMKLKDGRIYKTLVDLPKGEPMNPLTLEDLEHKLTSSCKFAGLTDKEISNLKILLTQETINLESVRKAIYKSFS